MKSDDSAELDEKTSTLAHRFLDCATRDYVRPRTFLGVGRMKEDYKRRMKGELLEPLKDFVDRAS